MFTDIYHLPQWTTCADYTVANEPFQYLENLNAQDAVEYHCD